MPELVTFAVAALMLFFSWRVALRPSLQGLFKDRLFDVRDRVRAKFAEKNQLDSPAYQTLRDIFNRYIRFVETASFSGTFGFSALLSKQPELAAEVTREIDRKFSFEDKELTKCAAEARRDACRIIQSYVFHSSFYSIAMIYFVFLPIAVVMAVSALLKKYAKTHVQAFSLMLARRAEVFRILLHEVRLLLALREDVTIQRRYAEVLSQRPTCAP